MLSPDFVLLPAVLALVIAAGIAVRRRFGFTQTLLLLVFVSCVAGVVAVTLFPLPIDARLIADQIAYRALSENAPYLSLMNNAVPFKSIVGSWHQGRAVFFYQVGGNFALLMPLGMLLPLVWPRAWRPRTCLIAIASTAAGIELMQLAVSMALGFTYRRADVDDVILNVAGGVLGYCVLLVGRHLVRAAYGALSPKADAALQSADD